MKVRLLRPLAIVASGLMVTASIIAVAPAANAVSAPGGLKVLRTGPTLTTLDITWKPVKDKISHYTVSVFNGQRQDLTVVPADATSLTTEAPGSCNRYRVRVSAVGTDGTTGTTNDFLVDRVGPGGPAALTASRTESGKGGVIEWSRPQGTHDITGYQVRVTNMGTGAVFLDEVTTRNRVDLTGLDPARQYSAKVTPLTGAGSCFTGTTVLYSALPSEPRSVVVTRDPATPARYTVTWTAPAWTGFGPITRYQVGYGSSRITDWVDVDGNSVELTLDPDAPQQFQVRAISSDDRGRSSKAVKVVKFGAAGAMVVDPRVDIRETDGVVSIQVAGPVGSHASFPKMRVRVEPTRSETGFRDQQIIDNGAGTVVFGQMPCGVHTVTVTGFGPMNEREFGRQIINRCDSGIVEDAQWRVVHGRAAVNGKAISFEGGENRVISTLQRSTSDMVFTTNAHLKSGKGYGIWTRADFTRETGVSGYSFQFDPGFAGVDPGFGPALLLRQWHNGKECWRPIARVRIPSDIAINTAHRVVVTVTGDSLFATIDNRVVFNVESLSAAVAASPCGMPMPTGTNVGFRGWGADTRAMFTNTTVS